MVLRGACYNERGNDDPKGVIFRHARSVRVVLVIIVGADVCNPTASNFGKTCFHRDGLTSEDSPKNESAPDSIESWDARQAFIARSVAALV